ncbi:tetratricopeptide repeat protein [Candidatus Dependentiae bacterium]|nr:tetratricopeptide repeat protein [Candidatus Dependentiae bacterium]
MMNLQELVQNKEVRNTIILAILALAIVGAWFGYKLYSKSYEEGAHNLFAQAMQEYNQALQGDNLSTWKDVEHAFEVAHQKYSKSHLVPYFLTYESDAVLRQGDEKRALQLMQDAVKNLSSNSPIYYLYKIKLSLMQMDSKDKDIAHQGKLTLENLAQENANPYKDMSLYYLGNNAFVNGQINEAKNSWQKMMQIASKDSVWANAAHSKLEFLS